MESNVRTGLQEAIRLCALLLAQDDTWTTKGLPPWGVDQEDLHEAVERWRAIQDDPPGCMACKLHADLLILLQGELYCMSCLTEKAKEEAIALAKYLVEMKHIPLT